MNKTDLVFYGSMIILIWSRIQDSIKPLISAKLFDWIAVAILIVGTICYAFYEKMNNVPLPPPQ